MSNVKAGRQITPNYENQTSDSYFQEIQRLILVNKEGERIGSGEKWQVHKEGILHKGFSVALFFQGKIILQKRKHPIFDKATDFTASSHPLLVEDKSQDEEKAVFDCLRREWNFKKKDLKNFKNIGSFIYKASDKAGFTEHELCTIYKADINFLPTPNFDFAYGFEVVDLSFLRKNQSLFPLAPWVKKAFSLLLF